MKELVKFKKNIFEKQESLPFKFDYPLKNTDSKIQKLRSDLVKIKNNFGNWDSREVILMHRDNLPPKTKRCILEIMSIHESITHSTNRFIDYKSKDNIALQTFLNIKRSFIDQHLRYLEWIVDLFKEINQKNQTVEILKNNKSEWPFWLERYFDKNNLAKLKVVKLISTVQQFYSSLKFPPSQIKLEGPLILQFSSKDTMDEYILKNRENEHVAISYLGNYQLRVSGVVQNIVNVISYSGDKTIKSFKNNYKDTNKLPNLPKVSPNAPIIGVLDSAISFISPFRNYIKVTSYIDNESKDLGHGEGVASIVYAGDILNDIFDNCGEFNVHLFEVFEEKISPSKFINRVENAVKSQCKEIKVWNLSINSANEEGFENGAVTWMASELDRIQSKYNVVIVQSAGNKYNLDDTGIKSPADAVKSIVVNSVSSLTDHKPPSYALKGSFDFFTRKPDVSFFGGHGLNPVKMLRNGKISESCGTSFAAPFVARKLAHLIHYENKTILEAKALIIHSAFINAKIHNKENGWGVVPTDVQDIVKTEDDSIRIIFNERIQDTRSIFQKIKIPQKNKQEYSVYMTVVASEKVDYKYGCEYIRSSVNVNMGPLNKEEKFFNNRKLHPHHSQTELGDVLTIERNLIKFYGKWKSTNCAYDVIKRPRGGIDFSRYGIHTKIDKRMSAIHSNSPHNLVCIVTLVHKDNEDKYTQFIQDNNLYIDNIIVHELEGGISLEGKF